MTVKACNVLKYIKQTNKKYYELITDKLCAKNYFTSKRFSNTFLLPNAKLVEKMDKADEHEALRMVKALILKGQYTSTSSSKVINLLNEELTNVGDLDKKIKLSSGEIWTTDKKLLYDYSGTDVPPSSASKQGGSCPYSDIHGGSESSTNDRKALCDQLCHQFKSNKNVFKEHCASLMNFVKRHNEPVFNALCYIVDNNPTVTWFFLMELGKSSNLLLPDKLFREWYNNGNPVPVNNACEIYSSLFEEVSSSDVNKRIKVIRTKLQENHCDKVELPDAIMQEYKSFVSSGVYPNHVEGVFKTDPLLKLMQDEIRYMYTDDEYVSEDESLDILKSTLWSNKTNGNDLSLANKDLLHDYINPSDFFTSGLVNFLNSQCFLYMPLNKEKNKQINGGIAGGRVKITYRGGKHRSSSSKSKSSLLLKSLIASIATLDADEKNEIKKSL